jgi:hypothetical protein
MSRLGFCCTIVLSCISVKETKNGILKSIDSRAENIKLNACR